LNLHSDRFSVFTNRVLATLPEADISLLRPHLQEISAPTERVICERGQRLDHVYFIHEGMVSLVTPFADGNGIELASLGRDNVVGAMAALGLRRAIARIVVRIKIHAARIATARVLEIIPAAKALRRALIADAELRLIEVQRIGGCNAVHPLESRLARWLLQAADCLDSSSIPVTQETVSQMLGVQRTTANLTLRIMAEAGAVRIRRGLLEIADRRILERLSCECYESGRAQARRLQAEHFDYAPAEEKLR
jgi:CRP-like cAMP-binding protein